MNVAFGDHQVTNWQADVEARTIGASIHTPVVYDGRWPDVDVGWGIDPIAQLSVHGLGDRLLGRRAGAPGPDCNPGEVIGTDPPPLANVPNTQRRGPARPAAARRRPSSRWSPTSCARTRRARSPTPATAGPATRSGSAGRSRALVLRGHSVADARSISATRAATTRGSSWPPERAFSCSTTRPLGRGLPARRVPTGRHRRRG